MADPTRPGEIADDATPGELAQQRQRHAMALVNHRYGIAVLGDAERAGRCLAVLACSAALAERAQTGRWVYAVEALAAGAGHEQVAAATGLEADELVAGLRAWANGQRRGGLIDADRHGEVLALLGDPPAAEPMDLPTWQLRRLVLLVDALGDPPLSTAERASLAVLARQDQVTVDNVAAVIRRARGADR